MKNINAIHENIIGYCKDVKGENCPNTCEYAVGIEKKLK
jgi:hypothetical protein